MMSELKTLKDLDYKSDFLPTRLVESEKLRAEAVKWYNTIAKNSNEYAMLWFIMKFFNLTEEDFLAEAIRKKALKYAIDNDDEIYKRLAEEYLKDE